MQSLLLPPPCTPWAPPTPPHREMHARHPADSPPPPLPASKGCRSPILPESSTPPRPQESQQLQNHLPVRIMTPTAITKLLLRARNMVDIAYTLCQFSKCSCKEGRCSRFKDEATGTLTLLAEPVCDQVRPPGSDCHVPAAQKSNASFLLMGPPLPPGHSLRPWNHGLYLTLLCPPKYSP